LNEGIIKKVKNGGVKILGQGELNKRLIVKANKISKSAAQKITDLGGQIEVI
jgi:large subunit ribosomal protein L15